MTWWLPPSILTPWPLLPEMVFRPMVLPVLGGLLIADEVIDLFLPVLFYRVRLWRIS